MPAPDDPRWYEATLRALVLMQEEGWLPRDLDFTDGEAVRAAVDAIPDGERRVIEALHATQGWAGTREVLTEVLPADEVEETLDLLAQHQEGG